MKKYEKNVYVIIVGIFYKGGNLYYMDVLFFGEFIEFEYLWKVFFEYMMGCEIKIMVKVIIIVLKFFDD